MCDYVPENPYLYYMVEVYDGTEAYQSVNLTTVDNTFNRDNPIAYFGKMKINNVLHYYVLGFGKRYYINSSDCKPLSYQLNSDPLPISEGETEGTDNTSNENTSTAESDVSDKLKIALILILVIPALIATAFLFKPQKKQQTEKKKYFYDENDYE